MTNEEKLREFIRKIMQEELNEISTSAGAGAYLTPLAFQGNNPKNKARKRSIATQLGYTLSHRGEKELNRSADTMENISEAKIRYHEYKKDESASPTKKIARAISEINQMLSEMERTIKLNARLQKESGITSEALYQRTQKGLLKLEARLVQLVSRIRDIRGK